MPESWVASMAFHQRSRKWFSYGSGDAGKTISCLISTTEIILFLVPYFIGLAITERINLNGGVWKTVQLGHASRNQSIITRYQQGLEEPWLQIAHHRLDQVSQDGARVFSQSSSRLFKHVWLRAKGFAHIELENNLLDLFWYRRKHRHIHLENRL